MRTRSYLTHLNSALGIVAYYGLGSLFFFLLLTKAKTKIPFLVLDFLGLNLIYLALSGAVQQGYSTSSLGSWGGLERWLLSYACFAFFIVYLFAKATRAGDAPASAAIFLKFASFFFLFAFSLAAASLLDSVITLEFMNVAMLLYFLQSLGAVRPIKLVRESPSSSAYEASSTKYSLQAAATLFFTMFFIAIFFFTFVSLTLFLVFGESSYSSLAYLRPMLPRDPYFFFFFVLLLLKVGGAPLHLWKLEVFGSLGLGYVVYYSVVYLFFFFSIVYSLFVKLGFYFSPEFLVFGCFVLLLNLLFIIANTYAVVEVRHFVVLSTLLNSTFFIFSILLIFETGVNFYALFFLNYLLTSLLFFIFFLNSGATLKFVSRVRGLSNRYVNFFFFLAPIAALSGAAPLFGFSIKLLLLVSCVGNQYSAIFTLVILSIIFTLTFYFQVFKNFFFTSSQSPSSIGSSVTSYAITLVSIVVLAAPASLSFITYFYNGAIGHGAL